MTIKSDIIQFMRTLVRGDFDANDRYERKLDEEGWEGWPLFLGAIFFLAVYRRFNGKYDETETIRLVAGIRSKAGQGGPPIDPSSAERLIKAVFDPSVQIDISPEASGHIQTLAAYTILSEENLSDEALNDLLDKARAIADEQPD